MPSISNACVPLIMPNNNANDAITDTIRCRMPNAESSLFECDAFQCRIQTLHYSNQSSIPRHVDDANGVTGE